ncbi:hypothetical protein CDD83_4561 [Cordyceps sp. RAO-2017]|nr:hypothetical protein CDD83_4561 [Cordyceps sp. RAO-2017]
MDAGDADGRGWQMLMDEAGRCWRHGVGVGQRGADAVCPRSDGILIGARDEARPGPAAPSGCSIRAGSAVELAADARHQGPWPLAVSRRLSPSLAVSRRLASLQRMIGPRPKLLVTATLMARTNSQPDGSLPSEREAAGRLSLAARR